MMRSSRTSTCLLCQFTRLRLQPRAPLSQAQQVYISRPLSRSRPRLNIIPANTHNDQAAIDGHYARDTSAEDIQERLGREDESEIDEEDFEPSREDPSGEGSKGPDDQLQARFRIVPESPSYFSTKPAYTDFYLRAFDLVRKYADLPRIPKKDEPRVFWKDLTQFRSMLGEQIMLGRYRKVRSLVKRLNSIDRSMLPDDAKEVIRQFLRDGNPLLRMPRPEFVDEHGRSIGIGRRKSSSAQVWLVEGDGQVLINDKPLHHVFPRIHDRESALWALKVTSRLERYNVWALTTGGGSTGQAEAITLGLARALIIQEPGLKPVLRKAGTVTRNPKRVERKKPGRLKARKRPTWVKR